MRKLPPLPAELLARHREMYAGTVDKALKNLCPGSPIERNYLDELLKFNHGLDGMLLVAEAEALIDLVQRIEEIFGRGKLLPEIEGFNQQLRDIFDYDGFVRRKGQKQAPWGGTTLMQEITKNVKYCPYCNAETVFAVRIDEEKHPHIVKSAFDHYFPRARYPFLGLALYNLIPSCTRCNTNLKVEKWEDLTDMPHPYLDEDVHSTMRFVPVFASDGDFSRPAADNIRTLKVVSRQVNRVPQTRHYLHVFETEAVYSTLFRQEAADIIWKAVNMGSSYGEVMTRFVGNTGLPCQDFERLVWGAPLMAKEINRHRLAKMTIDLEHEFCRP